MATSDTSAALHNKKVIYAQKSPKSLRTIGIFIAFASAMYLAYPLYAESLEIRLSARQERIDNVMEGNVEEEGRVTVELLPVIAYYLKSDVIHQLFGTEMFNDEFMYQTKRMLHTDYMIVLNGAGAIGVLAYFSIFLIMWTEKQKYYKHVRSRRLAQELNAVFIALFAVSFIVAISGSVYDISLRSVFYLYCGGIVGVFRASGARKWRARLPLGRKPAPANVQA